jgi:hypothetical protein
VPLLLLSSSADLSHEDLGAWMAGLLAGDAALSGHVSAHCIHVLPRMPSAAATQQLLRGLQWLAQHAPAQPQLKVPAWPSILPDQQVPNNRSQVLSCACGRP